MKMRKTILKDTTTGEFLEVPVYERGMPEYKEQQKIRRAARVSARRLIKAFPVKRK